MTVGVVTCPSDYPAIEIARQMVETGMEEIVVLEEGNAIGVVNQDCLMKAFTHNELNGLTAEDIMEIGIKQVPSDSPLKTAVQLMLDQETRALYLTHHASGVEYPAAVISYRHILRLLAADNPKDLSDLGVLADRPSPLDVFIRRRDEARRKAGYSGKRR